MKIVYLANARIPTEKAHGIQIMKMCEAFSKLGHDIELVVPRRFNHIKKNPFSYYNITTKFPIKRLPCLDLVELGFIGFLIQSITFGISVFFYLRKSKFDILYGREEFSLYFESFMNTSFVWETHTDRYNFVIKRVLRKAKKIVSITNGLKQFYVDLGLSSEKIAVSPDAVDLKDFSGRTTKEEARKKLKLPIGEKIVVYTGGLYAWKGVEVLASAILDRLPKDVSAYFVGGTDREIKRFEGTSMLMKRVGRETRLLITTALPIARYSVSFDGYDIFVTGVSGLGITKMSQSIMNLGTS